MAYDPSTGLTSISVGEAGAAARFETHLYLNPAKTPLYAGGGGVRSDGGQGRPWSLTLHTFSVSNRMQRAGTPLALRGARLTVRDSGDPRTAAAIASRYHDAPFWLFIDQVASPLPGMLRVIATPVPAHDDGTERQDGRHDASAPADGPPGSVGTSIELWRGPAAEHLGIPVEAGTLLPGTYALALEYVEPEFRVPVVATELTVLQGGLAVRLELEHNRPWESNGKMRATLRLEADRDLSGVRPQIIARPEDRSHPGDVVFGDRIDLAGGESFVVPLTFQASNPHFVQTFELRESSGQVALAFEVIEPPRTRYIAPEGSDSAAGVTPETAWRTFGHALPRLRPGDTLILMNGIYERETTGLLELDCSWSWGPQSGQPDAPITVKAFAERAAWIKGDGRTDTMSVVNCRHWHFEGLRVSSADNRAASAGNGRLVRVDGSEGIVLRRLLVHHNNRYTNSNHIYINLSRNVLIEETEFYYFHRNGITVHLSDGVTVRRSYGNSRGYADIPGGYPSGWDKGGDRTFVAYYTSNFLVENSVSEKQNLGFGQISGERTAAGRPSGENNRYLGIISINDYEPGRVQSRKLNPDSQPIRGGYYKDFLIVTPQNSGFTLRAVKDIVMENVTAIGARVPAVTAALFEGNEGNFGCHEIGGCSVRMTNWLIMNGESAAIQLPAQWPGVYIEHSNFWNNRGGVGYSGDLHGSTGLVRRSTSVPPAGMGLAYGQCIVFVPAESNMKGAGKDGEDIGASILYRYVDGVLTDEPLWDPETGAFPHGAIVPGINDVPGDSLFDLHQRLNVNTNGCTLPYSNESG